MSGEDSNLVASDDDEEEHSELAELNPLKSIAKVSYEGLHLELLGTPDFPMIEATLEPGTWMMAEPGRMIMLPEDVEFSTVMGDGKAAGVMAIMKKSASRMLSGESLIMAKFENESDEDKVMRFGTVIPGYVLALNLADYGGELIGSGGVYLCGSEHVQAAACFKQSLGAAFFGGESFILQKLTGPGIVLLQGGGTVLKEELTQQNPSIRVDTGCIVAFTTNVDYTVSQAGGLKSMLFGGEGLFHAVITLKSGQKKGTVWIESFPYSKWISRIKSCYSH